MLMLSYLKVRERYIADPNEVEVTQLDGTKFSAYFDCNCGSRAHRPNIPGQVSLLVLIYHCNLLLCM
jgi:hypothetical protein